MWQVLCGEESVLRRVFSQLLEVLTLTLPYQEKHKGNKVLRYPTETPQTVSPPPPFDVCCGLSHSKQATKAFAVLCSKEETTPISKELFSKVFSVLLLRIGVSSTIETDAKSPSCIR